MKSFQTRPFREASAHVGRQVTWRACQRAFTLIELMVVVAIVGIIAAFAVPQYDQYIKRTQFAQGIAMAEALKKPVAACLIRYSGDPRGAGATCQSGKNGVPPTVGTVSQPSSHSFIDTLTVSQEGRIYLRAKQNLDGAGYLLTPSYQPGFITWNVTGNCTQFGLC